MRELRNPKSSSSLTEGTSPRTHAPNHHPGVAIKERVDGRRGYLLEEWDWGQCETEKYNRDVRDAGETEVDGIRHGI